MTRAERIDVPVTSYSRLELYTQCARKYKNRYIDKIRVDKPIQKSLIKGVLVHECLEVLNKPGRDENLTKRDIFLQCLDSWLRDLKIQISDDKLFDLCQFAESYGKLITRGSSRAKSDFIRNSDGTVPKSLEDYPPRNFSSVVKELGLKEKKLVWDSFASSQIPDFWEFSFAFLVAECYSLFNDFEWADFIAASCDVEFAISTNKNNLVQFSDELYLLGYIDWIVRTVDNQYAFLDYKTGKTKPSQEEVLHHPQLNLYAKASEILFGAVPELIGIYHAMSGEYIIAPTNQSIVNENFNYLLSIQDSIDKEAFPKQHPGMFGSKCKTYDYKTKGYKYCEYLPTCWSKLSRSLNLD